MRFFEFLNESFPLAKKEFSQTTDAATVDQYLKDFKQLVSKNQVSGDEKDINYWRRAGFDKLKQFVDQKKTAPTKTAVKRSKDAGKSIVVQDDANWTIVIPLDQAASCYYGSGTDWCTTKIHGEEFAWYFYEKGDTLVYIINKATKDKWAIAFNSQAISDQIFDKNDKVLGDEEFQQQSGLSLKKISQLIAPYAAQVAQGRRETKKYDLTSLMDRYLGLGRRVPELERAIFARRNGKAAALYAAQNLYSRWPEAEEFIVKDGEAAMDYARNVLRARWPEAEPYIAKNGEAAALYVATVYPHRWPEAEPAILKAHPTSIINYLFGLGYPRWPEAEPILAKDPNGASKYAIKVLKGPWPEAEAAIASENYPKRDYESFLKSIGKKPATY